MLIPIPLAWVDDSIFQIEKYTWQYKKVYDHWSKLDDPAKRAELRELMNGYRREWLEWHGGDAGDLHDLAVGIEKELP